MSDFIRKITGTYLTEADKQVLQLLKKHKSETISVVGSGGVNIAASEVIAGNGYKESVKAVAAIDANVASSSSEEEKK